MCKESVNVEELRKEVMADGVVTKEEVEMLWDKKDSQDYTTCKFDAFFAEAVMAWLLADGQIDEEEAQFLIDKISEDADIDDAGQTVAFVTPEKGQVPATGDGGSAAALAFALTGAAAAAAGILLAWRKRNATSG